MSHRAQEPDSTPPGPAPTRLVVVAEDDDELRWLLAQALQRRGWRVVELEDAFELDDYFAFIERLGAPDGLPDVVLTDVRMPGGSGLDALKRARAAGVRCPFLVLTSFPGPVMAREVSDLGHARLLGKPTPLARVTESVEALARGEE